MASTRLSNGGLADSQALPSLNEDAAPSHDGLDGSHQVIDADYVIVFSLSATTGSAKDTPRAKQGTKIKEEYVKLLNSLQAAGLLAVGRSGRPGHQEILVFVKAPEGRLVQELERERTCDWLHGVNCNDLNDSTASHSVTQAERLRHIYHIITQESSSGGSSSASSLLSLAGPGAGITKLSFPQVQAIIPLHDQEFNHRWLKKWSQKFTIHIPLSDLDEIKDHFGEALGFYFAFLKTYFQWLAFPSIVGSLVWRVGWSYSTFYATVLVLWSTTFVEYWRVKERLLAVRWRCYRSNAVQWPRASFRPLKEEADPITGEKIGLFPWWQRELRYMATIPVLLGFIVGLLSLICGITIIEVLLNEVYKGPGKQVAALLPTVLFVGLVPQIVGLWQKVALRLVDWENHSVESAYNRSLTLKMFALNAIVAYTGLFITAFIYVPFGSLLVPHLATIVHSFAQKESVPVETNQLDKSAFSWSTYTINSDRLHTQLFAYTVTNQAINAFTEVGLPLLTGYFGDKIENYKAMKAVKKENDFSSSDADVPGEKAFLDRVRREVNMPDYTLFTDFAEMAIQFGYVAVWTVVWPIAPLFALLNNFFELRTDSFKLTSQSRRPIPARTDTIGPWLETLGIVTWVSALMNAALIYIFKPLPADPQSVSSHITATTKGSIPANNQTVLGDSLTRVKAQFASKVVSNLTDSGSASASPAYALRGILFSALLVALASEHGYFLARQVIRHVIERIYWKDSNEERQQRVVEWEMKRSYLDSMGTVKHLDHQSLDKEDRNCSEQAPQDNTSEGGRAVKRSQVSADFWKRGDLGMGVIEARNKLD